MGTTFTLLGYIFWRNIDTVTTIAGRGAIGFAILVALFVGGYQAFKRLRHPRAARERFAAGSTARRSGRSLRPLRLRAVARAASARGAAAVLALRAEAAVAVLSPAAALPRSTASRPGGLGIELTTLLAIAAVCIYTGRLHRPARADASDAR